MNGKSVLAVTLFTSLYIYTQQPGTPKSVKENRNPLPMTKTISVLKLLFWICFASFSISNGQAKPLFDHEAIRNPDMLTMGVMQDWHLVDGPVPTRQKVINLVVHELIEGQPYCVPVRFIVPADGKAKGFHLTGGHGLRDFEGDGKVFRLDQTLLKGGIGRVQTMVQTLDQSRQGELGSLLQKRFLETLAPKFSIQYYGWPLVLMKAITAAHAETDHFVPGKIAMSGSSKNGATPTVVLNVDNRTTAVFGSVSPIWDSPLRLCDKEAWNALNEFNLKYEAEVKARGEKMRGTLLRHPFLGGTYGPIYNRRALEAGHEWADLKALAEAMAENVFVSRHFERHQARGAECFFQPGTHDFVCFDLIWGGQRHFQIPIYLSANSGHGIKPKHPKADQGSANLDAFLLQHFFDDCSGRLLPPISEGTVDGKTLTVRVKLREGQKAESGQIWWIYDRGPDGSAAYLRNRFPDDQWAEMTWNAEQAAWFAEIELREGAKTVDFFTNYQKTLLFRGQDLKTVTSSPYTRVHLSAHQQ